MKKVLIAVASRHHATEGIGTELACALKNRGYDVTTLHADEVRSLDEYDAVILGSGVYAGHWLKPAAEFARKHQQALKTRPLWLFSCGPIGDPPLPREDPVEVAPILKATEAREHHLFAGRLQKGDLNLLERAMVAAFHAPMGDFRDWNEVHHWASEIAATLRADKAATTA